MNRIFPYQYDLHDYPNGLRLITVPTGLPHIVSLQIVVHAAQVIQIQKTERVRLDKPSPDTH